jgi:GT2 family glycosyltransferase
MSITAIVNIYKRIHILDEQILAIKNQSIKAECIFIWNNGNNSVDLTKYKNDPIIRVFDNNFNYGVWSRFLIGFMAPSEYICIFDDDTIPGCRWFENCMLNMNKKQALYGTIGVIFDFLETYQPLKRYGWDQRYLSCEEQKNVDIVGHSWFFKKEWLRYFVMDEPKVYSQFTNGEDVHFSFMLQSFECNHF